MRGSQKHKALRSEFEMTHTTRLRTRITWRHNCGSSKLSNCTQDAIPVVALELWMSSCLLKTSFVAALICLSGASQAVITFDEVPAQAANGVTISGVSIFAPSTYQIGVPPRALPGISGAALYGTGAGVVQLSFAPSTRVAFDLAVFVPPGTSFFGIATFLVGGPGGSTLQQSSLTPPILSNGTGQLRFDSSFAGAGLLPGAVQLGFTLPAGGVVAIDNLQVGPVPEPASAALLLAGLLALAAKARRPQRI